VKDIVYWPNESNQTHINLNASTRQESGMVIGRKEIPELGHDGRILCRGLVACDQDTGIGSVVGNPKMSPRRTERSLFIGKSLKNGSFCSALKNSTDKVGRFGEPYLHSMRTALFPGREQVRIGIL